MVAKLTAAAANGALDYIVDLLDGGDLVLYSGTEPATADDAATTEVATLGLNTPAFSAASENGTNARATLETGTDVEDTSATGGTVTHFRFLTSGATAVIQGDVTGTGGGGDIEIASTTVGAGSTVRVSSLTIDLPQDGA